MEPLPDEPYKVSPRCTLEEYVMELFRSKKTASEEFKAILNIYGRDKMEAIWEKYKKESPQ